MKPYQPLLAQLEQRFPGVDFEIQPTSKGSFGIHWYSSQPPTEQVASYFRQSGFYVGSWPEKPGHLQVRIPGLATAGQTHIPRQPQQSSSINRAVENPARRRSKNPPASFGAQGLWSISDLEVIREIAEKWVNGLTTRNTVAYYTGGMSLLVLATGYLAWVLDIHPSLIFGRHLATQLASEWISLKLLSAVIFLLSITPNLLEFFATGLAAHGNVIVDIAIKTALLFDAATDAPMAFSISKSFVGFFIHEPVWWSGPLAVLTAFPILLLSTVVVEILFLSFFVALVLLIRRSGELGHTSGRSYGRPNR
jgi:hypothetical protein